MNKLAALKFATVAETVKTTSPSASVRENGKLYFSDTANKLIGYDGKNEDRMYFQIGSDDAGVIYLVPAKKDTPNILKAAKNGDTFQFNDIKTIADLGMEIKNRYAVAQLEEDGTVFYSLTKKTAAFSAAEDAKNVKDHAPVVEADIRSKMERSVKPLPTQKEMDAAAIKAAKSDFKKGK